MVRNWNTMTIEQDVKESIEEFKEEFGGSNSEILRYAMEAALQAKKLDAPKLVKVQESE